MSALLPSECPNCGAMHGGHDFDANPGPVQVSRDRILDDMRAAAKNWILPALESFKESLKREDAW